MKKNPLNHLIADICVDHEVEHIGQIENWRKSRSL
jgi:hypothetical protein